MLSSKSKTSLTAALLAGLIGLTPNTLLAHEYTLGDLFIDHPVARATAPGAKVGAGYVSITNKGTQEAVLLNGQSDFADKVEIHESKMNNGVMTMKAFSDGLVIPAGETITLKPGGNHVMFMKLSEPLVAGEKRDVTLNFKKAGALKVKFNVLTIEETLKLGKEMDHSKMKMESN